MMAYLRGATVSDDALVSVVMTTRNRSGVVGRAIESLLAQTYARWELVVVDDGSTDDTPRVLDEFSGDARIRRLHGEQQGPATARNRALHEAAGEYVTYLDDDNVMHPGWLRAVVWALANRPDIEVVYGATIVDDVTGAGRDPGDAWPWLRFVPYERAQAERENPTDLGAMAHRARLPEAVFDAELEPVEDWDLLLRLTRDRAPLALPAVACTYTTDAPARLSRSEEHDRRARALLRTKHELPS